MNDLRYAFRTLLKNPGFSAVAILTLAIGIGANTAMFAVVNGVLLKPLPFSDPELLMLVHLLAPNREGERGALREMNWSYPKYQTFLEMQQAFEDSALFGGRGFTITGDTDGSAERVRGEVVTERYPTVLGVAPIIGRSFTAEESRRTGAAAVAMLGHALWMRRYGGDTAILGRTILVDAVPCTVVGVLPRGFRGLNGDAEIWIPLAVLEPHNLELRYSHSYYLIARRRPAVTESAAVTAVRAYGAQIDAAVPRPGFLGPDPWGATAASLYDSRADADVRRVALILLGSVGLVLLIACVNLTNLLVAKAIARRREVAVRMAIGASRLQVARQFVVESLLLAGVGATLAVFLARALLEGAAVLLPEADVFFRSPIAPGVLRTTGAAGLTRIGASMVHIDASAFLFACGTAAVAAVLVALVPAMHASALRPVDAIKTSGGAGTMRGFRAFGARAMLVTAQIAFALVLLAGAGLMLKSASRLQSTDVGIDPRDVLTTTISLPRASYSEESGRAFYSQLIDRIAAVPGVESVGLGGCPPVSGGCNATGITFPREAPLPAGTLAPLVGIDWASRDYFSTLGIRFLQGRNFTEGDRTGQPKVAIVNEVAAHTFWPNDSPLGKIIGVGMGDFGDGAEIVGVVSNVRYSAIEALPRPYVYIPIGQSYAPTMRLFVRSRVEPERLAFAIRQEVRTLNPNLPLIDVKTMEERLGDAMWRTRIATWLLSAFAALAVLLTAIGIFGLMSQTVSQRTQEIGVRMALGAQKDDVLRLVLSGAASLAAVGILGGVVLALGLTNLMQALLYQVAPNDLSTFSMVAALVAAVALVACYLPARRAMNVNPIVALRYE